ncbi:hypothetical protein SYNPS1DRAFT_24319 [Syncephalis pseudoplumigaleata]|uniref:Uncharacterized protein n=1 Tax=Syncephalis pseudoplumigaleata TaxID=1712513 RepID=A0A4P9YVZ2_9FUNG|nr:hypothetical protein SYNPS1DRAFT_24319 [Syncephalis pseudoplumigaleata]|eukprot:RKP23612.1 hypothetical protein SYNPS1DRAFT_24319 [Syncephalis pseudoplumigaleata]
MKKSDIFILSSLLFNLVAALAHLYRQWETKAMAYWPLFFVHLALTIVNVLLILFHVSVFFVGPASGVVCAIVVTMLLRQCLVYLLYALYPVCGVIWFASTMVPYDTLETFNIEFNLYVIAVYIYGGAQAIQSLFSLVLVIGLCRMKGGNVALKRAQIARLTVLSLLMVLPNMSNFQLPYISPIIWLVWSCVALWPRALADMHVPLTFGAPTAHGARHCHAMEHGTSQHDRADDSGGDGSLDRQSSANGSEKHSFGGASSLTNTTHLNTGSVDEGGAPPPIHIPRALPSNDSCGSGPLLTAGSTDPLLDVAARRAIAEEAALERRIDRDTDEHQRRSLDEHGLFAEAHTVQR